jgi:hypothetical protein
MNTFEKEISYVSCVYNPETEKEAEMSVVKTVTFKELSRLDKDQHKLHFKLISLFEGLEKDSDDSSIGISSDALYDITVKAINILVINNDSFTAVDKKDFLSDSIALLEFGMWLFKEKFSPFFSKFKLI